MILFFLNPDIPFDSALLARAIGGLGLLVGLPAGLAQLAILRGDFERHFQFFPYAVTLVLAISALGFWIHPHYFQDFLPPGIVSRLFKAAVSVTLTTLVCFYALVWKSWRKRPFSWPNQILVIVMAIVSLSVVVERREAFKPRAESFRQTLFESRARPFLFVVGIDSASLDTILPLTEQGRLPFLARVLEVGSRASVVPLEPHRPYSAWASLATGKWPYKHGVLGNETYLVRFFDLDVRLKLLPAALFFEKWAPGLRRQPTDSHDLQTLPLWRMLARQGVPTAVIGWPTTSPVPEDGTSTISDAFFSSSGLQLTSNEIPLSLVSSAELGRRAALFQVQPTHLDPTVLARFDRNLQDLTDVRQRLASDLWREDLACYLAAPSQELQALFVRLPGLSQIAKDYSYDFSAAPFDAVVDEKDRLAGQVLASYYRHLDDFLARLWESRPEPKWLAIISPRGSDHSLRRKILARLPFEESTVPADGFFLLMGEGIESGVLVRRATPYDLVPTLLYGLGFPIARDLDGNILNPIFQTSFVARQPLTFVPSYETLAVSPIPPSRIAP